MKKGRRGITLNEAKVRQVQRLLAAGMPPGQVAAHAEVSHDVVARIRTHGRDYRRVPSKHQRCPGCGGLQTNPCIVCRERGAA
jgi:hypothetical protein